MEGLVLFWIAAMGVIVALERRHVEALLLTAWIAMGLCALYEGVRLMAWWLL